MEREEKITSDVEKKNEAGATMIEYALLAALISVVCIGTITVIGTNADVKFQSVSAGLAN
jgi:pilus assembly protein Flp/PilA